MLCLNELAGRIPVALTSTVGDPHCFGYGSFTRFGTRRSHTFLDTAVLEVKYAAS